MSASAIEPELTGTQFKVKFTNNWPMVMMPPDLGLNIDDPVNDTGVGPHRGDMQLSEEFACLPRMI